MASIISVMKRDRKYVYVVCGDKKYIHALHVSLRYLKHFSSLEILVVTDNSRNEITIEHDHVVSIATPQSLTNHEASIYLKTSIYKHLLAGPIYCYIDTDVIAVSNDVDRIFDHFSPPVTFAPDHYPLPFFSPYAVKCNCIAENLRLRLTLAVLEKKHRNSIETYDKKRQSKFKLFINLMQEWLLATSTQQTIQASQAFEELMKFWEKENPGSAKSLPPNCTGQLETLLPKGDERERLLFLLEHLHDLVGSELLMVRLNKIRTIMAT